MNNISTVVIAMVLITSLWVLIDTISLGARKGLLKGFFDMGPLGWTLSCLLFWPLCFPLYLSNRSNLVQAVKQTAKFGPYPGQIGTPAGGAATPPHPCPHCGPKAPLMKMMLPSRHFICSACGFQQPPR